VDKELRTVNDEALPGPGHGQDIPLDPADARERRGLVAEVRGLIGDKYGPDYERRCGVCAVFMLSALRQMGITSFRIAAGGVNALSASTKGRPAGPRWEGVYTKTGSSNYHVWLVNDAGEKIDCSELPTEYNRTHLWEPHDLVSELNYIERPETTTAVQDDVATKYRI
jgi:hypothetical protein